MERNILYNEDCIGKHGMGTYIEDKSIDLILCDLPYGTTQNDWDSIISFKYLWAEYKRVIKDNGAILLFAQTPFDKILGVSNLEMLRYEWIWEKSTGTGFLNAEKMPLKAHENILVFYKKLPTYNPIKTKGALKVSLKESKDKCEKSSTYGKHINTKDYCSDERYPRSILKFKTDKQNLNLHPTQKPVKLLEYLIKTYTNENDLVLDNCMGSGSTVIGCINTRRDYIGFELDKEYYNLAKERIDSHTAAFNCEVGLFSEEMQKSLFD